MKEYPETTVSQPEEQGLTSWADRAYHESAPAGVDAKTSAAISQSVYDKIMAVPSDEREVAYKQLKSQEWAISEEAELALQEEGSETPKIKETIQELEV
jgi:hypothetical protein